MRLKKIYCESMYTMRTAKLFVGIIILLISMGAQAQKKTTKKPVKKAAVTKPLPAKTQPDKTKSTTASLDPAQDEKKVTEMVQFLGYVLNMLGSNQTSARDKDVLVKESYAKIFRDAKVQIEDDLDENRTVVTNKDVVAYLKDVDFFFDNATFEFIIEDIKKGENASGKLFYKVSLKRNLKGTTTDGKSVNKTIARFIEVNYNEADQDFKIVSIYTNQINEKDALITWWKELPYEWQSIFKKKLSIIDSVTINEMMKIAAIEALDLSNNKYVQDIEPLERLTNLKTLNLSNTNVTNLSPLRNLNELEDLNLSHTTVQVITSLKYANKLKVLNLNQTSVADISVVQQMPLLEKLDIGKTSVVDLTPLANLVQISNLNLHGSKISDLSSLPNLHLLKDLNISATLVQDLNSLNTLKNLETLDMDSTQISNISTLTNLQNLKVVHANYTLISDLKPFEKHKQLEKIYVDQTPLKQEAIDFLRAANPTVLIIFDTKDLELWWGTLPKEWQDVLMKAANINSAPTKEDLAKVTLLDSINFTGIQNITDLEPLRKLQKLQVVVTAKTSIVGLSPLEEHQEIRYLDISETAVQDLTVLHTFKKLKVIRADKSKVESLDHLTGITSLEKLYLDETPIHDIIVRDFLEKNSNCLVIHKTIHLNRWWKNLSLEWRNVFRKQMTSDTTTTRENLHKLVEQKVLNFKDASINDLQVLTEFVRLEELHISGTAVSEIPVLENLKSLKSLHVTNGPLQKIETLNQFVMLEDLDISNTPIDDLKAIGSLTNLKTFNCAGTQIKKLSSLEALQLLTYLDCSNTNVSKLDPIISLPLKTLKCYNTKISSREIESFKKSNTTCEVVYYR